MVIYNNNLGIFYFSFAGGYDNDFFLRLCTNNIEIKQIKIRSKLFDDNGLKVLLN